MDVTHPRVAPVPPAPEREVIPISIPEALPEKRQRSVALASSSAGSTAEAGEVAVANEATGADSARPTVALLKPPTIENGPTALEETTASTSFTQGPDQVRPERLAVESPRPPRFRRPEPGAIAREMPEVQRLNAIERPHTSAAVLTPVTAPGPMEGAGASTVDGAASGVSLAATRSSAPTPDRVLLVERDPMPVLTGLTDELNHLEQAQFPFPEDDESDLIPGREILTIPGQGSQPAPAEAETSVPIPVDEPPTPTEAPTAPTTGTVDPANNPSGTGEVLELDADYQEFDTIRQIFVAEGNVEMIFRQARLTANRLRVNLLNRIAVAEGDVVLRRGDQIIFGNRLEYNFVQQQGALRGARGEIFLPSAGNDLTLLPSDLTVGATPGQPISQTATENQPDVPITSPGSIDITVGSEQDGGLELGGTEGEVRRIRFEAEEIEFYPEGWRATNVRLTNDPFSPPELELRSPLVTYTRLSPFRAELRARNPIIVFDQGFRLPLLRDRVIIDNRRRDNTPLAEIGFDEDFGGLYLERTFDIVNTPQAQFSLTPLLLVQRAVEDNGYNLLDPTSLGLRARLDVAFNPQTSLEARAVFESLDFTELEDRFRGSIRARHVVARHTIALEYSFRDRLYNGSLGYQRVQRSLGVLVTSPSYQLGNSGVYLSYQGGVQYINARTDVPDLLEPDRDNDRISLTRAQGSVALSRLFNLWAGQPLPATPEEGLRYTPNPITPYVQLVTAVRGTASFYSSDDSQLTLTGTIGLQGQLGHFSRDFLDYTAFGIYFSKTLQEGESPFLFDRAVDQEVLTLRLSQQLYGPLRIGFQTSINLENNDAIDTDYILEYSRRTYSIILRFNPEREIGSLNFRINDFNWGGTRPPFAGAGDAGTVEGGVRRD